LQTAVWAKVDLTVREFPFVMFSVRSAGNPTSHSPGDNHTALQPFECMAALTACQTTNLSRGLQTISANQITGFEHAFWSQIR
jgi:hypothetical protein